MVTLRTGADLARAGLIDVDDVREADGIAERYAIAVTPAMARLITDPADAIAQQFVPDRRERLTDPEEIADPIGDEAHEVVRGLIHRYPDRVLLKLVSACAVYCRFCFRRETVGDGSGNLSRDDVAAALAYIRAHPDVWEVILSGGDPLVASPARLAALIEELAAIPHVAVVRLHTRMPVVTPERITGELAAALTGTRLACWVAIHANHPRELTPEALAACDRLRQAGATLVSQTVLLKGVNDDVGTLADLMRGFVAAGIKPYYLHHPDLAPGTAHFRVSIPRGQQLVDDLRRAVSGLCQPVYVLDVPGGAGKVPIHASAVSETADGPVVVDRQGQRHTRRAWFDPT